MIIDRLDHHILPLLEESHEVWMAVALIKDNGYDPIKAALDRNQNACRQNYLIGVDLPTTPSVLRKIYEHLPGNPVRARIAKYDNVFHAKVYIFRKNYRLTAIIGSANLTKPGISANHEICCLTETQADCRRLIQWFDELYADAHLLTPENIAEYERHYTPGDERSDDRRPRQPLRFTRPDPEELFFEGLDLSQHFFQKEDYLAFRASLQSKSTPAAIAKRVAVKAKFLELHSNIFPRFVQYNIDGLDKHGREENIVSLPYHTTYTGDELDAMWLSYGKKNEGTKRYQETRGPWAPKQKGTGQSEESLTFSNHARIQIRIDLKALDISLLFAKDNAGEFDREYFKSKMHSPAYRREFFDALRSLPDAYEIRVNDRGKNVRSFINQEELHEFTKNDNSSHYFNIVRKYAVDDPSLTCRNLPTTVLEQFEELFKLYDLMRHKIL